jgi:hypothetical protein
MIARYRPRSGLLPPAPLLATESKNDFDQLCDALNEEIKPRNIVECMYVSDIAYLFWEILRLRRCKAALINSRVRHALEDLLPELLREAGEFAHEREGEANDLAYRWFTDQEVKKQIAKLLKQFHLDESAIEAEAFRKSGAELEQIDRLLASQESRRNRALRCIAEYRGGLARQIQESRQKIIQGRVLPLAHSSNETPPHAA